MTPLSVGQEATFNVGATDGTNPRAANLVAQLDTFGTVGYIALVTPTEVHFVALGAGTGVVTITGHSQDGTALTPITKEFTVGATPVTQANTITASEPVVKNQDITTPPNPGSDTILISV